MTSITDALSRWRAATSARCSSRSVEGERDVGRSSSSDSIAARLSGTILTGWLRSLPMCGERPARAQRPERCSQRCSAAAATCRGRRCRHCRGALRCGEGGLVAYRSASRRARSTPLAKRMPSADEIVVDWPEPPFEQLRTRPRHAVVVLNARREVRHSGARDGPAHRRLLCGCSWQPAGAGEASGAAASRRALGEAKKSAAARAAGRVIVLRARGVSSSSILALGARSAPRLRLGGARLEVDVRIHVER